MPQRRRGYRAINYKLIFIILGALLVVAIAAALVLAFSESTAEAERGKLSFERSAKGIVVRSETLYESRGYGKTVFLAEEGQAVTAGTDIAEVYSGEYNETDVASLYSLQDKIMDYQQEYVLSGVQNSNLEAMNTSINAKTAEISKIVAGDATGDILKLERELRQLMDDRRKFLKETLNTDEQLKTFFDQESALETRINDWRSTIQAEADGVVSFYFDGAETLLTPENIKKLTVKNIQDIMAGKADLSAVAGQAQGESTTGNNTVSRPLYRLVKQNLWYVVIISDEKVPEFENADSAFRVDFGSSVESAEPYTAHVVSCEEDAGKYIYALEFTDNIDQLLLARQVEMTIRADYVGLKVPQNAIKTIDGVKGIYYMNNGQKQFAPVNVMIVKDDEAIVETVDMASPLAEGMEIYS